MCNSMSSVLPGQGVWYLKGCSLWWLTDGVSMQTLTAFMVIAFLSVVIIKRFYFQIALPPFCPPLVPQITFLSVLYLVSDYHKAFDKIHCLLKKNPTFLTAVFRLLSTRMKQFAKMGQNLFYFPVIMNVGLNDVSSSPYVH